MKVFATALLILASPLSAQVNKPLTLREVLLNQLRSTDDKEEWFVPITIAVKGVTAEQAKWIPPHGDHSVGQLVNHLAFWNERNLQQFENKTPKAFSGNNDETFNSFDARSWPATVKRLEDVMKEWETAVVNADDAKIAASSVQIAHVGAHNAYHLGQIIVIRKLQGSWNPAEGVK